ncbi:NAD-dependent epimerase/dehydratase family protein [Pseudanabaena yagii]|uniref:NAD(P)-dependent oxidoreductase n=1 Tax=Pseudanabaena yagii GIHE-NHR1 TaxID=2722753 RepID=A0ABX1M032_9CYAN|nr:NAD(P)-dependent oxidoreductase [Pseudanabaena yagii]NMF60570.1 NAD(P)-dependent oxidoreductase [Pseudanabaena yagii GIHE-NHR1]
MKIGIVGASGFVGNRAAEVFYEQGHEIRPIVRSQASAERLTPKNLDYQIASAFDQSQLAAAFKGCDVVIHSVLGSPGLIRGSVEPAYKAAQKAGVRRIIYLSSMIVHRSAPAVGTTEASPLVEKQQFPAHPAKIYAERKLLKLRQNGAVEVVIFRPGIVFGPRSRWVSELANQLCQGTAYFINEGKGVCNSVYIDNLIHGIQLGMTTPAADGEAFFVGDREQVTWFDFYRPFAEAFGVDPNQIPNLVVPEFTHSRKQELIGSVVNSQFVQKFLASVPEDFKQNLKNIIPKRNKPSVTQVEELTKTEKKPEPVVNEMMAELQQSQYKLPFDKAERILGYQQIVSFDEGCRLSIEWLSQLKQFQAFLKK